MKKNMALEVNAQQAQKASAGNASLLPYTPPELSVYNQSKITMGGVKLVAQDFIGPSTFYRKS